jgi:pimeloyl-ACP methyl ester carboxylesterase
MDNLRLKRWLHRIDIPTLLLWGAEDPIVTPVYGEGWRQAIPGARLEVIQKAGHFPHWEHPKSSLNDHRAHWYERLSGGRGSCASGTSRRWPTTRPGKRV